MLHCISRSCETTILKSLLNLPCSELTDEDVRTAIKNSGGVRGSLLIPDAPFELLVRRAISRLLTPALQCKEFVHAELLRIAAQCAPADITRFPKLQARTRSPSSSPDLLRCGTSRSFLLTVLPRCILACKARLAGFQL